MEFFPSQPNEFSAADRTLGKKQWRQGLSFAFFIVAISGIALDALAASQVLVDAGPNSLGVVWGLGGIGMLLSARLQVAIPSHIDRGKVVRWLCAISAIGLIVVALGFLSEMPTKIPAAAAWLFADQLNFLFPLVFWTVAGDMFTAGEGIVVFPKMSRWIFVGQTLGLVFATALPLFVEVSTPVIVATILSVSVLQFSVAIILPRILKEHARETNRTAMKFSLRDSLAYIKDLPSFNYMMKGAFFTFVGGAFSGGQRQRLLIARALATRPRILILDEATSALDNVTQKVVTKNLAELGMTRIVVAHRLSTIIDADRILMLEKGRVIEEGTYEELMEQKGAFHALAIRQVL